jgi:FlaA1/EpsC-like NDP-sugar epimerase
VRFGNVLGSRGSLLGILAEQMAAGQPVTVTHPDVTRFFMTIEEAVGLVLEAARMAQSGETYVLDMGDPVRIVDLVANLADQLHVPDVQIRFTGLRPGEKLNETLVSDGETRRPTVHPRVFQVDDQHPAAGELPRRLRELYALAKVNSGPEVRKMLIRLLPEYDATIVGAELVAAPYPDGF